MNELWEYLVVEQQPTMQSVDQEESEFEYKPEFLPEKVVRKSSRIGKHTQFFTAIAETGENMGPTTIEGALNSIYAIEWKKAMKSEVDSFFQNETRD